MRIVPRLRVRAAVAGLVLAASLGRASAADPPLADRVASAIESGMARLEEVATARRYLEHTFPPNLALASVVFHADYARRGRAADAVHAALRPHVTKAREADRPAAWVEWAHLATQCMALSRRRQLVRSGVIRERTMDASVDEKNTVWVANRLAQDMVLADPAGPDRLWIGHDVNTDHSLHWGLLALHEAQEAAIPVADRVWRTALRDLLAMREGAPGGSARGWIAPYARGTVASPPPATALATAGGVAAAALCMAHLRDAADEPLRNEGARAIESGMDWLDANFSSVEDVGDRRDAPGVAQPMLLLAYEAAFDALSVKRVRGRDWFAEGAEYLLATQSSDGSWGSMGGRLHTQAHPLLFLLRPTRPLTAVTPSRRDVEDATPPDPRGTVLDEVVRTAVRQWPAVRRASERADAHAQFVGGFSRFGPEVIPRLIRRLADPDADVRGPALELLSRLFADALRTAMPPGLFVAPPDDDTARRGFSQAWTAWWVEHGDELTRDEAAGRITSK